MEIIFLFLAAIVLLFILPEPATRIGTNPTPTGDIRSFIGIGILLVVLFVGMIISSIRNKKDK